MKALDKIREIILTFKNQNLEYPEKQAQEIVCHVIRIEKTKLFTENPEITPRQAHLIDSFVQRRLKREPLQYILGRCEFYNIKVKVRPGVLIPRPETEILVEEIIKRKKLIAERGNKIIDLCTGSGCIALAVGKNIPEFQVFGADISEKAIFYAKENKILNRIKNTHFIVGNLFEPFKKKTFACIVSNPPYVKTEEIKRLQPEIRDYEPLEALDGGSDGLKFYRKIIKDAKEYLVKKGLIFFEIGSGQSEAIQKIASSNDFKIVSLLKDLAGFERVMILKNN
uniref:Release factor glutamine methyltransferase n=1 Tax=Thermodesulfovibrio aggregans TaxID=86166 RepID=A0A7C4AJ75_9BACT